MKTSTTIIAAALGLLFMADAAMADHSLSNLSDKVFGNPGEFNTPGQRSREIEEEQRRQWIDRERARQQWEADQRIYGTGGRIVDEQSRFLDSLGKWRRKMR